MHIDILGICGTFMGGIALIAREAGHRVTGADSNIYPPMSTLLEASGVAVRDGFEPHSHSDAADVTLVGNALGRGNPAVERLMNAGAAYTSGPQWLAENVLANRWVLAVSGTHGKTTTASMLANILDQAGLDPGFLIGGVPADFGQSARLGRGAFFVVEADEYDTAFFDKRSKFVHFRPRTLIINNIEYDHADIFPDLAAIQRQFHHLIRTVPGAGLILTNGDDANIDATLEMGCWSGVEKLGRQDGSPWQLTASGAAWRLHGDGVDVELPAPLPGEHNARNAAAALLAARHVGVPPVVGAQGLAAFSGVKRRLEIRGRAGGVTVLDDFAHHPTAIAATLRALRGSGDYRRLLAVVELRSNSMRLGIHRSRLAPALADADLIFCFEPEGLAWSLTESLAELADRVHIAGDVARLAGEVLTTASAGDAIVVMSNGGFGGIHERLLATLEQSAEGSDSG